MSPRLHSVTVGGSRTLDAATVSAMRAAAPGHVHGDRVLQNQSIRAYRAQRSSRVRRRRRLGRSLRRVSLKQYAGAGGDVGREILWSRQYLGERSSKKYQVALQRPAPAARRASPPRRCGGHAGVRPSHIRVVTARPRGGTRRRRRRSSSRDTLFARNIDVSSSSSTEKSASTIVVEAVTPSRTSAMR